MVEDQQNTTFGRYTLALNSKTLNPIVCASSTFLIRPERLLTVRGLNGRLEVRYRSIENAERKDCGMNRRVVTSLLIAAICVCGWSAVEAGKFNKKLSLGDAAPTWSKLTGTDEKEHSLDDYQAKLLVLVFTCNHCPVAIAYEDRFNQFATNYKDRDVQLVAINVNRGKGESLEKMAKRSSDKKFAFDYLKDDSQASAKKYGARTTPTVILLDQNRKVIYMGAFDDNWEAEEAVEKHYLTDAVDAALAEKTTEISETQATGCGIPYGQDDE